MPYCLLMIIALGLEVKFDKFDMSQCPDNRFKNVAILAYPSKSVK